MARLHFSWAFGLIFGLLALGSADQLEHFLNGKGFPLASDGLEVSINQLIDDNIELIHDVLSKFDPAKLPDLALLGKGHLTDGWLSVLSNLRRTGDSSLKYHEKVLGVDIKVGWEILKYDFDYAYKLWFIPRYGQLHGTVEKINVNLKLNVDFRNYAVILEEFKFGKVGKLGLELEGTFGDKIRALVGRLILNIAKKHVMHTVERIAAKTIQEKIDEFNRQILNEKHQFTFIDLVEANGNSYGDDDDIEVDF